MDKLKLLLIHGPNLNLTGMRQTDIYGMETLDDINAQIVRLGTDNGISVVCFQSNNDGAIIDLLHSVIGKVNGIIINAGALSHYSYALRDAIVACNIPTVEVHMSNIYAREEFRHVSVLAPVCVGSISGFGAQSYTLALNYFINNLEMR